MSKLFIVPSPASEKLWEQSWFYECIAFLEPDGTDSYLVPEKYVIELYGKHHQFSEHSERLEKIYDGYGYNPLQYRIEFDE